MSPHALGDGRAGLVAARRDGEAEDHGGQGRVELRREGQAREAGAVGAFAGAQLGVVGGVADHGGRGDQVDPERDADDEEADRDDEHRPVAEEEEDPVGEGGADVGRDERLAPAPAAHERRGEEQAQDHPADHGRAEGGEVGDVAEDDDGEFEAFGKTWAFVPYDLWVAEEGEVTARG